MDELKRLLTNPFAQFDVGSFKVKCHIIAIDLFRNFYIQCGTQMYYFAEIEFYYYDKDRFDKEWNTVTYPRTDKEAGDLFFHYSGVDICFDSNFKDGRFGGILIRSLKNTEGQFITGPSVCSLEMLNVCSKQKKWPQIIYKAGCNNCKVDITERFGIEYKSDVVEGEPLCFFDTQLSEVNNRKNKFENATWDFSKKESKSLTRYYQRDFTSLSK